MSIRFYSRYDLQAVFKKMAINIVILLGRYYFYKTLAVERLMAVYDFEVKLAKVMFFKCTVVYATLS